MFMYHLHDLHLQIFPSNSYLSFWIIILSVSYSFTLTLLFCFNSITQCRQVSILLQITLPMVMLIRFIMFMLVKAITLLASHHSWIDLITFVGQDPSNVPLEQRTRFPSPMAPFMYLNPLILVHSWILDSVNARIAQIIMFLENSLDVWNNLKEHFSKADHIRVSNLHVEINNIMQGSKYVLDYFTEFNGLWEELNSLRPNPICTWIQKCICKAMYSACEFRRSDQNI